MSPAASQPSSAEWTSNTGDNLHRNVIFAIMLIRRIRSYRSRQRTPLGRDNHIDIWKSMAAYGRRDGGSVPYPPLRTTARTCSNGRMFPIIDSLPENQSMEYAEQHAKVGDSSMAATRATVSFVLFHVAKRRVRRFSSIRDFGDLDAGAPKTKEVLEFEYARSALRRLKLGRQLGTNPCRLGMVRSSDAHTALAAMRKDVFGKTTPQSLVRNTWRRTFVERSKDWHHG